MANGVYRLYIESCTPATGGTLHFDTRVQLRSGTAGNYTYTDAIDGHRTLVLDATLVLAAVNDPLNNTNVKKRQAIYDLLKEQASGWKIAEADEANINVQSLLTFPDSNVVVRQ